MNYLQAHYCAAFAHSVPAYITYCYGMCSLHQTSVLYICTNDDTARIQVVVQSLALTQEFRAEDNVVAVIFFTDACGETNRNRRLDDHNCFRVILNYQLNNSFNRRSIKKIFLTVIVSALKFVRRSCSTVAYKAHLLPYVATYPLFRA